MLTNTTPADPQEDGACITATTLAIDDAERHHHTALLEIARLAEGGQITASEAADLEAETRRRLITEIRELELHGQEVVDPDSWAAYEARAAGLGAAAQTDRPRIPGLRGLSDRARALRERQMCVVLSARVSTDLLGGLRLEEDDEALALRGDLAAAGLL